MTAELAASIRVVELDWFAENEYVRVTPRDQDRFEVQKDRAIDILRLAKQAEQFDLQFTLLLRRLGEWINERQSKIDQAFLTYQDDNLAFVVVRADVRYDEDFEDELSELDFDIANDTDLHLLKVKTLALPQVSNESVLSFLDQRLVLSYQCHHGK